MGWDMGEGDELLRRSYIYAHGIQVTKIPRIYPNTIDFPQKHDKISTYIGFFHSWYK